MNKLGIGCLIIGLSSTVSAGSMGPTSNTETWYMVGGAGYSASMDSDITTDPAIWDFANQGYSNDLGSSASLFFGFGRYFAEYLPFSLCCIRPQTIKNLLLFNIGD